MEERYSKGEASQLIRQIAKHGSVVLSVHVRKRMHERSFEMRDVLSVLKKGAVYSEAELHPKTGRWTYRVTGKTVDHENLEVIVDIDAGSKRLIILTGIID